jgi:hypothetical protein
MSLAFKRHLPLLLLLVAILVILTFTIGNQPISGYTFNTAGQKDVETVFISTGLTKGE